MTVKALMPVRIVNLVAQLAHKATDMHITDTAMNSVASCAYYISASGQFDHHLQRRAALRYTPPVTSKKGVNGIGVPNDRAAKAATSAGRAAFSFAPQVLAARWEGRKTRRFKGSARSPVRQSCRAASLIGVWVAVVSTTDPEPKMAKPTLGPCAQIIQLPTAKAQPVVQTRKGGRLPGSIPAIWRERYERRTKKAYLERELQQLQEQLHFNEGMRLGLLSRLRQLQGISGKVAQ